MPESFIFIKGAKAMDFIDDKIREICRVLRNLIAETYAK